MILQMHTIKPAFGSRHKKKIVGRGNASGHGNYSGRGGKGQTARSGGSRGLVLKGFRALMQQTKKLRGFKSLAIKPAEVRLSDLEKKFNDGDTVNLRALIEKGIISRNVQSAKILRTGELKKKLVVEGVSCTTKAKEIIEKNGGQVK